MFKKMAIVLVALFAFGGTVSAYAWWDTLQEQELNQQITIGVGTDLVITETLNDGALTLIPSDALLGDTDTHSYVYTYRLDLSKQLQTDATLSATLGTVTVDGAANPGGVFVVESVVQSAINADQVAEVTVTVTMDVSANVDYVTYAGKVIAFDITFNAS